MSDLNTSEQWMLQRMKSGERFTFADLYMRYGGSSPQYRQADRLIQKHRKAGNIEQIQRNIWAWKKSEAV